MIDIYQAIYALNSSIVTIRGNVAYDKDEKVVAYDATAAQVKLAELQAAETVQEQTKEATKASALAKLTALGLTADEIKALLGTA
jgi:hypothetical protein